MKHKNKRQNAILSIINENNIDTQEELAYRLKMIGIDATQATISRDIKQLHLIKILDKETNKYRYEARNETQQNSANGVIKPFSILRESILSVRKAQNIVVVKCNSGMANAACAAIDAYQHEDIVGTLAGDDTIFIAAEDNEKAEIIINRIRDLLQD